MPILGLLYYREKPQNLDGTDNQFLAVPLSLGISALFFSVIHIFSRGLWIGIPQATSDDSLTVVASRFLDRLADKSYLAVFAQWLFGHISPQMMKTYSHVRRLALNAAAAALEPSSSLTPRQ
jgi:hypothetical protein